MITFEYISSFKKTNTYKIICEGVLNNNIEDLLLGEDPYTLSYSTDSVKTIPSQVLIGIHILILDSKISNERVNEAFRNLLITRKSVCLILDYIDTYLIYKSDNKAIKLEYDQKFKEIIEKKDDYIKMDCFKNLLALILKKL